MTSRKRIREEEVAEHKGEKRERRVLTNRGLHDDDFSGFIYEGDENEEIIGIDGYTVEDCKRSLIVVPKNHKVQPYPVHECDVSFDMVKEYDEKHPESLLDLKECSKFEQTLGRPKIIKDAINDYFVKQVANLGYLDKDQKVLVLDAYDLNTSRRLVNAGVARVTVPNPYECRHMRNIIENDEELRDRVTVASKDMGDWINQLIEEKRIDGYKKFTGVWADYMGCYSGNQSKEGGPREDVSRLFKYNLMATPSIFAITTSTRCGKKPADYQLKLFFKDLEKISKDTKYCFENLFAGRYRGKSGKITMAFAIVKVDEKGWCGEFKKDVYDADEFERQVLKLIQENSYDDLFDDYL